MKYIKTLVLILAFTNCKAQYTAIKPLEKRGAIENGIYYKDIGNLLNTFEGRYLYTNGSTSFEIILQKKILSNVNDIYYEDILIGSYKYVENGLTKVDVLSDINNTYPNGVNYKIFANFIRTGSRYCPECGTNEKWLRGRIVDPVSHSVDMLQIRKAMVDGQEAIKIFIFHELRARKSTDPIIPISYPLSQEINLIKQP